MVGIWYRKYSRERKRKENRKGTTELFMVQDNNLLKNDSYIKHTSIISNTNLQDLNKIYNKRNDRILHILVLRLKVPLQLPISSHSVHSSSGSFDQIWSKVKTVLLLINQPGGAPELQQNFFLPTKQKKATNNTNSFSFSSKHCIFLNIIPFNKSLAQFQVVQKQAGPLHVAWSNIELVEEITRSIFMFMARMIVTSRTL